MSHELDASFDSLLMSFTDSIEDTSDYFVHSFSSNSDDDIDESMMNFFLTNIHLVSMSEYRLLIGLNNNSIDHLLYELNVRVNLLLLFLLLLELGMGLCEHSSLFSRSFFRSLSFFFSYSCFVFLDLNSWAFLTPSLTLLWAEIDVPLMISFACHSDNCLLGHISCSCVHLDDKALALLSLHLAVDGSDDLYTVVAKSVNLVCESPERNLASMTVWLANMCLLSSCSSLFFTSLHDNFPMILVKVVFNLDFCKVNSITAAVLVFVFFISVHLCCDASNAIISLSATLV